MKELLKYLIIALLISCSVEDTELTFDKISETKTGYSNIELEILDLVNDYRLSKDIKALTLLNFVSSVALTHTNYMVETGLVDHHNFSERYFNLVYYANAKLVGEDIAYGYSCASGVVDAWIKSPGHIILLENKDYTHFGISIEQDSDLRSYFTLIFIKK